MCASVILSTTSSTKVVNATAVKSAVYTKMTLYLKCRREDYEHTHQERGKALPLCPHAARSIHGQRQHDLQHSYQTKGRNCSAVDCKGPDPAILCLLRLSMFRNRSKAFIVVSVTWLRLIGADSPNCEEKIEAALASAFALQSWTQSTRRILLTAARVNIFRSFDLIATCSPL